jgi:hypothetical protein
MPKGTALSPTLKLHASSMSSPVKPLSVRVLPPRTHERPQKTDACCRRRSKCDGRDADDAPGSDGGGRGVNASNTFAECWRFVR